MDMFQTPSSPVGRLDDRCIAGTKVVILDCCRDNPFASQIAAALGTKSLRTKGGGEISGYGYRSL